MDSKIKSGGRRDRLGRDRIGKVAAVAALAVLIVSTACKHPPAIKRWPAEMVDETEPSKSPAVEVNFYLDTTGSMQGFLHQPPGEANYFREVLNQAKSTLAGAWAPDTSRFTSSGASADQNPSRLRSSTTWTQKPTMGKERSSIKPFTMTPRRRARINCRA